MDTIPDIFTKTIERLERTKICCASADLKKEYRLTELFLVNHEDYIEINTLKVTYPGRGYGTRFLNDFTAVADIKGWILTLTPELGLGATSLRRLKRFYKRFGFVENKGRNTNFKILDTMIRLPNKNRH